MKKVKLLRKPPPPKSFFLWGFNDYARSFIEAGAQPAFIHDAHQSSCRYKDFDVVQSLHESDIPELCVVCSASHLGEIVVALEQEYPMLTHTYIGEFMSGLPIVEVLRTQEELERSSYINCSQYENIEVRGALTLLLKHFIPCTLASSSSSKVLLDNCTFMDGVEVSAYEEATIAIGTGSYINKHSIIRSKKNIIIGKGCAIAWNVSILDNDGHHVVGHKKSEEEIVIKDHVWICNGVTILKGTEIGQDCIVAAGAVVNGSFEPGSLIGGVPAKVIKDGINWK